MKNLDGLLNLLQAKLNKLQTEKQEALETIEKLENSIDNNLFFFLIASAKDYYDSQIESTDLIARITHNYIKEK